MGNSLGINSTVKIVRKYPYHWHDDLTIVMVVSGKVSIRMWARDNIMERGDFAVINPREVHKLEGVTNDNLIVVTSISEEFCKKVYGGYEDSVILCNSNRYRHKNPSKYKALELKLKDLICSYEEDENECSNIVLAATELVKYMYRNFDYLSVGNDLNRFSDYIITRNKMLYRKIFLNFGEYQNLSLKEIAEKLGVNYTYLRTDILEKFGHGFRWLKYTIMTENAARLALSTDMNLMNIGLQCGFSDQKYMIKYFKTFYECTPSQFRKKYKHVGNLNEDNLYVDIPIKYVMLFCEYMRKFS